MGDYVFVYGTLKRGFGNHVVMRDARGEFSDVAEIKGAKMYSYHGAFPFITFTSNEEDVVYGELYYLPPSRVDEGMEILDMLEGYPNFYNRKRVEVAGKSAWVYFMDREDDRFYEIPSGRWGDQHER